jgi:hypothetical protein
MKNRNLLDLFLMLILLTTACKKGTEKVSGTDSGNNPTTTTTEKVYYFTSDGVYLNNTKISNDLASVETSLDPRINVYANSAQSFFKNGVPKNNVNAPFRQTCYFVDGTDIYEGGYEMQTVAGNYLAKPAYWKNGVRMPLELDNWSEGLFTHEVTDIKKYNNEIYLCGITKISTISGVPPYNVLWKNGKFDYTANYSQYLAYQKPITVNGKLVSVSKDSNGIYRLNLTNLNLANISPGSDWYDVTTAFSFLSCEFNGTLYTVYTRIFKDNGYLGCRTGDIALPSKYLYVSSCTYNGKDEYICLADRTTQNYNIVYKNGIKMSLPAIFANTQIYKVIAK